MLCNTVSRTAVLATLLSLSAASPLNFLKRQAAPVPSSINQVVSVLLQETQYPLFNATAVVQGTQPGNGPVTCQGLYDSRGNFLDGTLPPLAFNLTCQNNAVTAEVLVYQYPKLTLRFGATGQQLGDADITLNKPGWVQTTGPPSESYSYKPSPPLNVTTDPLLLAIQPVNPLPSPL